MRSLFWLHVHALWPAWSATSVCNAAYANPGTYGVLRHLMWQSGRWPAKSLPSHHSLAKIAVRVEHFLGQHNSGKGQLCCRAWSGSAAFGLLLQT